MHAILER